MKNYYEILEVNKRASKEVIEKAYKVLVKKYHPDVYKGEKQKYAEKKIKEINEAYDILSDEFLKEQYDVELEKEMERIYQQKYNSSNSKSQYQINRTEQPNINNQNNINNVTNQINSKRNHKQGKNQELGTFARIIELTKELIKNKPKRDELKEITKNDIIALILTIIAVIVIGMILWFIPITNGWMRELLFENTLFNWIGSLFS